MFKNYIKIAFRNLVKNKVYSLINIIGLAVGMASAVLILLWIQNAISYDLFHKNKDRIYEAWNRGTFDGKVQCWNSTPKILGPTVKQEYPEVEDVARTNNQWFVTAVGERKISSSGMFADPSFLNIFSFPLVQGNAKTALDNVYSVVITEKMAKKMFGDEPAMNKVLRIDKDNFTVTGILKDLPANTRFDFEFLMPWTYLIKIGYDDSFWGNNSVNTFVLLKPHVSEASINAKIRNVTIKHSGGTEEQEVFLHPLSKWRLYSRFENGKVAGGFIETVRMFGMIAIFILLIACINFMNLSTARSESRAREVGIRKVSGANRGRLIMQFLGESVFLATLSGIVALLLVHISLPYFDDLVDRQLTVPYSSGNFWIAAVIFILFTGIIAGSYPAFFLSSFQPVKVLKGAFKKVHALITPRKVLVVLQFTFAIVLIISTIIIMHQIRYTQNRETGYDKNQLVYHFLTGDLNKNYSLVKNELLNSGLASSVNRTGSPLTEGWSDSWGFEWQGKAIDDKTDFDRFSADDDLVKTAGLTILKGRDMDLTRYPTDSNAMLLNESAAKAMGFTDPIGQVVKDGETKFHVIGVIKDFLLRSPYEPMRPMIIEGANGNNGLNVINIKLNNPQNTGEALARMEKIFRKYNPDYPFEYHFVDEQYARKFDDTRRTATLSALFAGLTIFISCLGLFGLATYMAGNRIKEIGVRKVLGASVFRITALLTKDFLVLVIISILISSPIAWYAMNKWLTSYTYRIHIEWWVFAVAAIVSILLSLLTVSYQSIKAAISNPVKSLRTE